MANKVLTSRSSTRDEDIAAIRTWLQVPRDRLLNIAGLADEYEQAAQTALEAIERELEERRGNS